MKQSYQAIMKKLQQQSDVLRHMPIKLKVTDSVDNGSVDIKKRLIELNPDYVSDPKKAVPTIAHELAHLAYFQLYGFKRNKEDETYADVYGMILCKRAGYDISDFRNDWNSELARMENTDEHPQNKIRYLIIKRAIAYLDDLESPKIDNQFTQQIRPDYTEAPFDITLRREMLRKKLGIEKTDKRSEQCNSDITRSNLPTGEFKQKLLSADLLYIESDNLVELAKRILAERVLSQNYKVLFKIHNALSQSAFEECTNADWYMEKYTPLLEEKMMRRLNIMKKQEKPQTFRENIEELLWHKNRFLSPEYRRQLQNWYADSLLEQYGPDNGTDRYAADLSKNLDKLNNRLHNADILPLLSNIKDKLQLKERNIPILQSFAQHNNQETKQVRLEVLVTECLLKEEQAIKTVQYLISDKLEPFCYECSDGRYWYNDFTRRNEPLKTVSLIKEDTLKEIHDDLTCISPQKRAETFCLLLENVCKGNNIGKLEMFVDNETGQNDPYKTLVNEYINTYNPQQQAYVVASLLSKKKLNRDYSYEDYFKTILENSGIDGIRTYNMLYNDKKAEEIVSLATNRTALHSQDMFVFANLRTLGQKMTQQPDSKLQEVGKKIIKATQKSIARPLKEYDI